jgi:hypothetical protein
MPCSYSFSLIALALLVDRWRGLSTYRFADAINSLSAGVQSTAVDLLTADGAESAVSVFGAHPAHPQTGLVRVAAYNPV